jgi:hypothetical protein
MGLDFAQTHRGEHANCTLTSVNGPVMRYAGDGAFDQIYWTLTTTDAEANGGRYVFTLYGYNAAGQRSSPQVQEFLLRRHTNACKSAARQVLGAVERFNNQLAKLDKYATANPMTLETLDRLVYAAHMAVLTRDEVENALVVAGTPCTTKGQRLFLGKVKGAVTPLDPNLFAKLDAFEKSAREQIAAQKPRPTTSADRNLIVKTLSTGDAIALKLAALMAFDA